MTYITTKEPIQGLEERCQRVQKILRTLHDNGFKNPIVYGEGLSHFLNNTRATFNERFHKRIRNILRESLDQSIDTPDEDSNDWIPDAYIKIECEFPEKLKPGILGSVFSTNAQKYNQCVQNARKFIDDLPVYISELRGITNARRWDDEDLRTVKLCTRGRRSQRIQIHAHNADILPDPIPSVKEALSSEFGTINKIIMRYDEKEDAIMTTRHKDWQADYKSGTFRIPGLADFEEINHSLAYYFSERADGRILHLETNNLDNDKSHYVQSIHDAALTVYTLHNTDVKARNAGKHSRDIYDEAVDFMETICNQYDPL